MDIPIAVVLVAGWILENILDRIPGGALISLIRVDLAGGVALAKLLGDAALGRGVEGDDIGLVNCSDKSSGQDARGGTNNGNGHREEVVEGDHVVGFSDRDLV